MSPFRDQAQMYEILGAFFDRIRFDPNLGPRLQSSHLVIRFIYTDPDGEVTINFSGPPPEEGAYGVYQFGPSPWEADVTMKQSADFSHRFWHGKANVMTALATRQIVARGSVPKALQLLPIIRPAFTIYPQVLQDLGYEALVLK
ncbi:MAG: SCP2 sterol-binding domain-containing protein [Firmicutes bacterium]|nr:SCP2 sterol-binding domain-containing protein [Bacillota bacterium]